MPIWASAALGSDSYCALSCGKLIHSWCKPWTANAIAHSAISKTIVRRAAKLTKMRREAMKTAAPLTHNHASLVAKRRLPDADVKKAASIIQIGKPQAKQSSAMPNFWRRLSSGTSKLAGKEVRFQIESLIAIVPTRIAITPNHSASPLSTATESLGK